MLDESITNHNKPRFWFGHLNDSKGGSLVIWDRKGPKPPDESVYLYVYKRDAIVQFVTKLVKTNLCPADDAEIKYLSESALESYFLALSQFQNELRLRKAENSLYPELPPGDKCFACGGNGCEQGNHFGSVSCAVCGGTGLTF